MDKSYQILLVGNHKIDEAVIKTIEAKTNASITHIYINSTGIKGISVLFRHRTYLQLAFKSMMLRKKFDCIIFWQQFVGIYYSVFCNLLMLKKQCKSIILTFIFKKRESFIGKLSYLVYKSSVNSKHIDKLVCHSSSELKYYITTFGHEEKFNFIKVGTRMPVNAPDSENTGNYFFAAGKSNRDYKTLISVFNQLDYPLIIAAPQNEIGNIAMKPNIKIISDAFGEEYLKLLKKSLAVVITIDNINISAGQLVLIEALRFGKYVIATDGPSMRDYTTPEISYFVQHHDTSELIRAVQSVYLKTEDIRARSNFFKNFYEQNYTILRYADRISDLVNDFTDFSEK